MTVRILIGDVRSRLRDLADESVHMICTSPPYYGLRSYLPEGHPDKHLEVGLERTPDEYVAKLVDVFRECRRVLRRDGVMFINIGSSYASKRIESNRYIIRRDIAEHERIEVAKALSAVWSGYESPESALQGLLAGRAHKAGELPCTTMRQMRSELYGSQNPRGDGAREVLLQNVREIRQPGAEADPTDDAMRRVCETVRETSCRDEEEPEQEGVLQPAVLVRLQSEAESLPLVRGAARQNKYRGSRVAEGGSRARPVSLSAVPCFAETGGSSHFAVPDAQGRALASQQRGDSLPDLPPESGPERIGIRRDFFVHCDGPGSNLADLTFPKSAIPHAFLAWCEPEIVVKPKDDLGIPWLLAFALRADGWWLRAENIWNKPACMPESVEDRTTRSHEHVFMFAKAQRYFYDAHAVAETSDPQQVKHNLRYAREYQAHTANVVRGSSQPGNVGNIGLHARAREDGKRNKRSVWTIASEPNSEAHFAMMPSALAEVCIKAGTSERGVCPHCGAPWKRVLGDAKPTGGRGAGNGFKREHRVSVGGRGDETPWVPKARELVGWSPSCSCPAHEPIPATVLDPFGGAGTTGMVADRLGRNAILIELNESYGHMAERRLHRDAGMFAQVQAERLQAAE